VLEKVLIGLTVSLVLYSVGMIRYLIPYFFQTEIVKPNRLMKLFNVSLIVAVISLVVLWVAINVLLGRLEDCLVLNRPDSISEVDYWIRVKMIFNLAVFAYLDFIALTLFMIIRVLRTSWTEKIK
jgi:hypothetical protein